MLETLAARLPGLPVHIGPSAIPARATPLGGQPVGDGRKRVALAKRDPRTRGLFGAAWLLGYVAQFAGTDVSAVTLMHLLGDAGLLQGEPASPVPAFFVLEALQEMQEIAPITGLPSGVCGVFFKSTSQSLELFANLRSKPVTVDVGLTGRRNPQAWVMNEDSIRAALVHPAAVSQPLSADDAATITQGSTNLWQPIHPNAAAQGLQLMAYVVLRVIT